MAHETRNPSPPPLTEEEHEALRGDFIGDTIFSKRWVLDLLLKLYKHDSELVYRTKNPSPEHVERNQEIPVQEVTLNENFENSICELWDMTANTDVALFLYENDCKDILLDAMDKTQSPRLMEICLGVLGNLVCTKEICASYSGDKTFRENVLGYLSITDALSLVELTRMICTCLARENCLNFWVHSVKETSSCERLIYLLRNSLNVDLVSRVVEILDIVFDVDNDIIDVSLSDEFLMTLIETYDALADVRKHELTGAAESLTSLLHILQTVTTVNKGIELLNSNHENVSNFLITKCLRPCRGSDHFRLPYYASVLSTLLLLMEEHSDIVLTLLDDHIEVLKNFVIFLRTECESGHQETDIRSFVIYLSVCLEALYRIYQQCSLNNGRQENEELGEKLSGVRKHLKEDKPVLNDIVKMISTGNEIFESAGEDGENLRKTSKLLEDIL